MPISTKTSLFETKTIKIYHLGHQYACTTSLLDLLFGRVAKSFRLDDKWLFREFAFSQNLVVAQLNNVDYGHFVAFTFLSFGQTPNAVNIHGWTV
jgi:hypothetical protein